MKLRAIPIKFGFFIGLALIIYFLLLAAIGWHTQPAFSLFNGVIVGLGIYYAIKSYRDKKQRKFRYQKGFMAGLLTGFNATILFTIFFGIYVRYIDQDFPELLMGNWATDYSTALAMLLFVEAVMGFASSVVLTLAFMQLFKSSWNTPEGKKHTVDG